MHKLESVHAVLQCEIGNLVCLAWRPFRRVSHAMRVRCRTNTEAQQTVVLCLTIAIQATVTNALSILAVFTEILSSNWNFNCGCQVEL
jgi:hypothetical protein